MAIAALFSRGKSGKAVFRPFFSRLLSLACALMVVVGSFSPQYALASARNAATETDTGRNTSGFEKQRLDGLTNESRLTDSIRQIAIGSSPRTLGTLQVDVPGSNQSHASLSPVSIVPAFTGSLEPVFGPGSTASANTNSGVSTFSRIPPYDFQEQNGIDCNYTEQLGTGYPTVSSDPSNGSISVILSTYKKGPLSLPIQSPKAQAVGRAGVGIAYIAAQTGRIKIDADVLIKGNDNLVESDVLYAPWLQLVDYINVAVEASISGLVQSGVEIQAYRPNSATNYPVDTIFEEKSISYLQPSWPMPQGIPGLPFFKSYPKTYPGVEPIKVNGVLPALELDVTEGEVLYICVGIKSTVLETSIFPAIAAASVAYESPGTKVSEIRINYLSQQPTPTPSPTPSPAPVPTPAPSCKGIWSIGQRVFLKKGAEIRTGSDSIYRVHTIVPEDGWVVDVIDGPRCGADGNDWWDVSRTAIDGGGTGWVNRIQAEYVTSPTQPNQPGDGIEVCDGANYGQPCKVFTEGKYSNLADYSWYDRVESVRFLGSYKNNYHVVLWSEKDFTGDPGHYDNDAATLGNAQQNHVRSLDIYRTTSGSGIELCDGENYGSPCQFFAVAYPEGKYADLSSVGFWDRAESVKFVGECADGKCHAVLWSEKDFTGDPAHYDYNTPTLGNAQKNHVRSVTVYKHQPPGPPNNPYPANGAVLDPITISLDVTFEGGGDQFQIHIWGNNYDQWRNWSASRGMHLAGLIPGQTYSWQAQGKNNIGMSPLSPQWSFTVALPTPIPVNIGAPTTVSPGGTFIAAVNIGSATNLNAFQFDLSYDKTVIQVTGAEGGAGVSPGTINGSAFPIDGWTFQPTPGTPSSKIRVLGHLPGTSTATGSGSVAQIHFTVVGSVGSSTTLIFSELGLLDDKGAAITTAMTGASVLVSTTSPWVTSLAPNTGAQGATLTAVQINGANLAGATAVTFSGTGVTASAVTVVNNAQITTTITITSGATLGAKDVTVTIPGSTNAVLVGGFTVTAAQHDSLFSALFGNGQDGALTVPGNLADIPIDSACAGTAGTWTLSTTNTSFLPGQAILIHQSRGTGAGQFERNTIQGYSSGTITLQNPLKYTYSTGSQVSVLKQYTNVTVNNGVTWTAKPWNGTTGGILAFLANGTVTVTGIISATGKGFRGGAGGLRDAVYAGQTGESSAGLGAWNGGDGVNSTANLSGGQGGYGRPGGGEATGGGGGGHSNAGGNSARGDNYGGIPSTDSADLTTMLFGAGGGGGGAAPLHHNPANEGAPGGAGGGIIYISASTLTNNGNIVSNGNNGNNTIIYPNLLEDGGGGGGAGGSVLLKANVGTLGGSSINTFGGAGGNGDHSREDGGAGSVGRIHLDYYTSYTGTTNPPLNASQIQPSVVSLTSYPSPTVAGASNSFNATAQDGAGTTTTSYIGTVHFTSSDSQAILPANYTFVSSNNGTKTFNATFKTAGVQSITATDMTTATVPGTQSGIIVNPATKNKLIWGTQPPATVMAGATWPGFTVKITDQYGNLTADTDNITISPSTGSLGGTLSKAAVAGAATFNDISRDAAGPLSLTATSGALSPSQFTIVVTDNIPPTVSSQNPAAGATGVTINVQPSVFFSEGMAPGSITAATVKLMQGASTVTATVALTAGNTQAVITPSNALLNNTTYFISVTTGVTDAAGNALAMAYGSSTTSQFTTVAPNQSPTAVITSPASGAAYTTNDTISFNGSQSSDPDGDALSYEWSSSEDGILGITSTLTKKLSAGSHTISLKVSDGKGGQNTASVNINVSQAKSRDVKWSSHGTPISMKSGEMMGVQITLTNTGSQTWPKGGANPVYVSYHWVNASTGQTVVWDGLRSQLPEDAASGQAKTITASLWAPSTAGTYNLIWDVVQEGVTWFSGQEAPQLPVSNITVATSQAKDVQWVSQATPTTIKPGAMVGVPITLTNTGSQSWPKGGSNSVYVSYHWVKDGQVVVWDGLRTTFPIDMANGQMVNLIASLMAPAIPGTYTLYWDVVHENVTWFSALGTPLIGVTGINVFASQTRDVQWVSQSTPSTMQASQTVNVPITLTNIGSQFWPKSGANPVNLSYHWLNASTGEVVTWDGERILLPKDISIGELVNLNATLKAPSTPGNYVLLWDMIQDGVTWFSSQGAPLLYVPGIVVQ